MKNMTQQLHHESGRKNVFTMLLFGIAVSFILYGFAIASTTLSIANADTDNKNINELQTEIAELEIEYFEIINTLSIEHAEAKGFYELSNVHYAVIGEKKSFAYNI
ncbi:MAG: hypothetical protein ACI870_000357 [Crocinitomicaceae bacterium]|jgi:hypothetical protein